MLINIILIEKDVSQLRRSEDQERIYSQYCSALKREWKSSADFIRHRLFSFERRLVHFVDNDSNGDDMNVVRIETKGQTIEFDDNQHPNNGNDTDGVRIEVENEGQDIEVDDNQLPNTNLNQPKKYLVESNKSSPPNGFVWEAVKHSTMNSDNCLVREKVIESNTEIMRVIARNDFPYYFENEIEHWCLWKLCKTDSGCVDVEEGDDITEEDIKWARYQLDLNEGLILSGAVENKGLIEDMLYWVNPSHLKSIAGINHAHILCLRKKV